jgi:outer membrane protein assembly factor BamB
MMWETHLVGAQFVNVHWEGDLVIAATRGELFCLDPSNGSINWRNGLKGMGYGMVTIAGSEGNAQAIAEALNRQRQAANSGAAVSS